MYTKQRSRRKDPPKNLPQESFEGDKTCTCGNSALSSDGEVVPAWTIAYILSTRKPAHVLHKAASQQY